MNPDIDGSHFGIDLKGFQLVDKAILESTAPVNERVKELEKINRVIHYGLGKCIEERDTLKAELVDLRKVAAKLALYLKQAMDNDNDPYNEACTCVLNNYSRRKRHEETSVGCHIRGLLGLSSHKLYMGGVCVKNAHLLDTNVLCNWMAHTLCISISIRKGIINEIEPRLRK